MFSVKEDFILYSTRTSVHRYMFSSGRDEILPLSGVKDIVALDYDYNNNCLYYSDTELDIIQVRNVQMDNIAIPVRNDQVLLSLSYEKNMFRCSIVSNG